MGGIKQYFKIAWKNLKMRRLRSWLTTIGIIIGVFLIVSLMSLSEGLKGAVLDQLSMMGKDLITIVPGDVSDIATTMIGGLEITNEDIKIIEKIKGVETVVPMTYQSEVVRYEGEKKIAIIYGNPWESAIDVYKEDMGWTLKEGRYPVPGKSEILVGNLVPKEIFPDLEVGTQAVIRGRKFLVVGVLNTIGSKQDDSMIMLDLDIFREITGERDGAKMAFAKVAAGYDTDEIVKEIKEELEQNKKRKRGGDSSASSFTVLSSEKIQEIVGDVMGVIQLVIFGFASIAIVVGGIGIMNTMYTSVKERTKEIGIMKAIGAKNSTIVNIFLAESAIFGAMGGIGGTLLGLILAKTIEIYFQINPVFYLKADVSPGLIFFALAFSFIVGGVSGYLPSRSAAKMKPVDALRYE